MTDILDLIAKNRSFRRFSGERRPTHGELLKMIEAARLSASAGNLQRLLFTPVTSDADCRATLENLAFAAYFGSWRPAEDEVPGAYIVVWAAAELDANLAIDAGIAAQSILLTAREMGFGGCMFRSIKKEALTAALGKSPYVPVLVIALGLPKEQVVITDVGEDGSIKYFRDAQGTHFVPKKSLNDIIL